MDFICGWVSEGALGILLTCRKKRNARVVVTNPVVSLMGVDHSSLQPARENKLGEPRKSGAKTGFPQLIFFPNLFFSPTYFYFPRHLNFRQSPDFDISFMFFFVFLQIHFPNLFFSPTYLYFGMNLDFRAGDFPNFFFPQLIFFPNLFTRAGCRPAAPGIRTVLKVVH